MSRHLTNEHPETREGPPRAIRGDALARMQQVQTRSRRRAAAAVSRPKRIMRHHTIVEDSSFESCLGPSSSSSGYATHSDFCPSPSSSPVRDDYRFVPPQPSQPPRLPPLRSFLATLSMEEPRRQTARPSHASPPGSTVDRDLNIVFTFRPWSPALSRDSSSSGGFFQEPSATQWNHARCDGEKRKRTPQEH